MDFFLSTSLKSGDMNGGGELVEALAGFWVDGLELEYRIRPEAIPGVRRAIADARFSVASVHNYFPVPDIRPRRPGGGDFFNLASLDDDEQREAVKWSIKTLENAADFGADAVVVHCGRVEMDAQTDQVKAYARAGRMQSDEAAAFVAAKTGDLERKKPAHLDRLLSSLDRMINAARRLNVRLGLENRYHYHELPGLKDFDMLFREFDGAPIGYWHDTGHAHANETFGFHAAADPLKRFGGRLIGVHIHDAEGIDDHLPPGNGEIDFTYLLPHLGDHVKRVFEIHPGAPDAQVAESISRFKAFAAENGA